jgi:hypothetical protein
VCLALVPQSRNPGPVSRLRWSPPDSGNRRRNCGISGVPRPPAFWRGGPPETADGRLPKLSLLQCAVAKKCARNPFGIRTSENARLKALWNVQLQKNTGGWVPNAPRWKGSGGATARQEGFDSQGLLSKNRTRQGAFLHVRHGLCPVRGPAAIPVPARERMRARP